MTNATLQEEIKRLCLTEGDSSCAVVDHFLKWRKKEPWIYGKWVFNKYTYALITLAILAAVATSIATYSIGTNIAGFILGYFLSQYIFGWGHMTTHALYIESPVEKWEPGVFVAWLHHYCSPKEIYKNWLVHRLNFLMQKKGTTIALGLVWVLPFLIFGAVLVPLYVWFLFWFSMVEPVHEFYHVPKEERKTHFSFPVYWFLRGLQGFGLLNEKDHLQHHRHNKTDLKSVTKFYDLYWPFADSIFDIFWRTAIGFGDLFPEHEQPIRRALYLQGGILVPAMFLIGAFLFQLTG